MSKWNVGIYLRLSSEDGDKDESNSIKNQRKMIQYYIKEQKDMKEYKPYIDDGYTGTDLERPGFKEMLNDIYKGNINCIIIKDTSRLGRNYVKVESFLCDVVRAYNIRLISLNDNIDSYLNPYSLISLEMSFKNLINESYAKDTSNKIKTALNISKKNGNFVGKIAPFGYIKNEDDIHLFEIDPEAAQIVKKIFDLASDGLSRQEIVKTLNEYNIITPSLYFKNQLKYDMSKVTKIWSVQMVDDILKNETYTGKLIQGTRERISHKNHKIVRVPEDEWIIIEHHHKPIIKQKNLIM